MKLLKSQLTADVGFSGGAPDGAGEIVSAGLTISLPTTVGPARL
jgi:hypothetical protein